MIYIILLLFVCRNVIADVTIEEGNALVDDILKSLKNYEEIEPLILPDHDISITKTILWVEMRNEIFLRQGVGFGLPNLTRKDDVILTDDETSTLITANLELENIFLKYEIRVIFFNKEMKPFNISGYTNNNKIILKIRVNKKDNELSFHDLKVSTLKGIHVNLRIFSGNVFRWIDNVFQTTVLNILKKDITGLVKGKLREICEKEIANRNAAF